MAYPKHWFFKIYSEWKQNDDARRPVGLRRLVEEK
jgi:hypothetical protein